MQRLSLLQLRTNKLILINLFVLGQTVYKHIITVHNEQWEEGNLYQRWFIESETSHWNLISCVSVTWVLLQPRPFRRLEAVLSLFILMGEMNMITDYDQFFRPIITKIHIGPVFSQDTYLMVFFRHTNQEKINFVRDLSHSCKIWGLVLPALLHNEHKQTFTWSYR